MWRTLLQAALAISLLASFSAAALAQSNAERVAQAVAAGPSNITQNATVKDWPDNTGKMAVLRQGTNDWVCLPSQPPNQYRKNNAMCLDPQWQEWFASAIENRHPKVTKVGYAYMLTADEWGSNTDPMGATAPTPDNQWHKQGSHVMMLYPDARMLEGIPATPSTTGPYIMMAGTPHAHVMWPMK